MFDSSFPDQPVSPREFVEEVIPSLFSEIELEDAETEVELRLGIVLVGEGGGDWTLHFEGGELGISPGRSEACDLSLVQSVADWRSALWEGRPALIADGVDQIRRDGVEFLRPPAPPGGGARPDPRKGIADLRGRIDLIIDGEAQADWRIGVLVGAGPIPDAPQALIRLGAAEADEIRKGRLHPLEALITGQLQLDGDLGLILQLQAVAMTLSMAGAGSATR